MNDPTQVSDLSPAAGGQSLLKRAREAQGLTLEGLASTIKVTPGKLAALESGQYQDLPDAAFARALAMTVCRVLKIDPVPVLAGLPAAQPVSLMPSEQRAVPFDASRTKLRLNMDLSPSRAKWPAVLSPQWLVPLAVLVAALVVYLWPEHVEWPAWWPQQNASMQAEVEPEAVSPAASVPAEATPATEATAVEAAASDGTLPVPSGEPALLPGGAPASSLPVGLVTGGPAASSAVVGGLAFSDAPLAAPAAVAPAPGTSSSGALVMAASESSWVEVRDGTGKRLLSRHVEAGETVGIDGKTPLAVRIGNAGGMHVTYLGHEVELAAFTRNNVAKLELK